MGGRIFSWLCCHHSRIIDVVKYQKPSAARAVRAIQELPRPLRGHQRTVSDWLSYHVRGI
jgi:hypothetical protein